MQVHKTEGETVIQYILNRFDKNKKQLPPEKQRVRYGVFASCIGIAANLVLFLVKLFTGFLTNSIAIITDAFNNLSDIGSSAVTLLGFQISRKPADEKHPFGYGRFEYISGLVVSFIILYVGVQFIFQSVNKILHPESTLFSYTTLILLLLSILVKLWVSRFNSKIGEKIHSTALTASGTDAFNDVIATSATVFSLVFAKFSDFPIDGYVGVLVALFVLFSGIGIAKDTLGPLLGAAPDKELVEKMKDKILSYEGISGVHDIIIHNYGPQRYIASAHAEVASDCEISKMHDTIDLAEREIRETMDILLSIHLDPIETNDKKTLQVKQMVENIVEQIDSRLTIHDLRVVFGETHTNLIFDVVVPPKFQLNDSQLKAQIDEKIKRKNIKYFTVITVDRGFI